MLASAQGLASSACRNAPPAGVIRLPHFAWVSLMQTGAMHGV